MRTTLDLDPVVLAAAKDLANHSRQSIGAVISELARRGLATGKASVAEQSKSGFPVFSVPESTPPVTSEKVREILADEDLPA